MYIEYTFLTTFIDTWMSTFQLKAYAQSQNAAPEIDSTYMGWAVFGQDIHMVTDHDIYGGIKRSIIPAAYFVPIIPIIIIISATVIIVFKSESSKTLLQKRLNMISKSSTSQGSLVALVIISILITVYIFVLDVYTLYVSLYQKSSLPTYYPHHHDGYGLQINFILGLSCLLSIFFVVVNCCTCGYCSCCYIFCCTSPGKDPFALGPFIATLVTCLGSSVLLVSVHIPNILMAWAGDPLYASRIAIYYAIVLISNFTAIKNAYIVGYNIGNYDPKGTIREYGRIKYCCTTLKLIQPICVVFSVFFAFILVISNNYYLCCNHSSP